MAQDQDQGGVTADPDDLATEMPQRAYPAPQAAAREQISQRLGTPTRLELRPIATPVPMGFFGLAGATFIVASLNLGWIASSESHVAAFVLLAFVVPLQATAAAFGTLARDGVFATGMAVLTGTWATFGVVLLTSQPGSTSDALGVLLLVAAICMAMGALGAVLGKIVPALVLFGASLRFATAGIYQLTGSPRWESVTGWIGVGLGALALYAGLAALLEGVQKRTVLPMGRRRRGRQATEGGLTEQIVDLTHEPGVRQEL
jgi:succinate-acetate transporter protein